MSIKYHFFGKDCVIDRALSNRADLERALKEKNFPIDSVLFLNQIHSNQVVVVDAPEKIYGKQDLPKADALVTNLANVVIGVITADCSPVLFFDDKNKIIAAIHAGWRGAKAGVIAATVLEMKKLGAENIEAIIGPMIQQKSYEVSRDFLDDFLSEDPANKSFFINGLATDKYLFDLQSYVEKKIAECGIAKIQNSRIDTYTNEEKYFSFRRSTHQKESDCGRNVSVIALS
jgi:YfiH family protein